MLSNRMFYFCVSALMGLVLSADLRAQAPTKVVIETVRRAPFYDPINALGSLRANESVALTVNVAETVTAIHFDDGERVSKGTLLVEMTSAEENALLQEAQSNLNEAKVQFDRVKKLAKAGTTSESLLDQRQRDYQAAKARLQGTQSRLKDRIVVAPFDGVLGLRQLSVGTLIEPGQVITTLNDDSKMKLDFSVPAIYLAALKVGLPIVAQSSAYKNKEFIGEVSSISNQVDPVTRSIILRAIIPNDDYLLKQGMLMRVAVQKNPRDTLVVSESALVTQGEKQFVWFAVKNDEGYRVEKRQVSIGARRAGEVEIVSGINEGDVVVREGGIKLREGTNVVPTDNLAGA